MGSISSDNELVSEARSLLEKTVRSSDEKYGFGTLTCTVYDTAWVSLVTKTIDGQKQWLFPQSFEYLLGTQAEDGSWANELQAPIDGVLNTATALLSLREHRDNPLQLAHDPKDLDTRITHGVTALRSRLTTWDVSTTNNVGFEIIVPSILKMLESHGFEFDFRGKEALMKIHDAKMSRFNPEVLYSTSRSTITHSLEALIGRVDFDRLAQHKVLGSMFASPSSTAAYLMHCSKWDDEAEAYLRHAIEGSAGRSSGGVPGVFPTTHFEYTWTLSTLLRVGFSSSDLNCPELGKMVKVIVDGYEGGNGVIGLMPGILADVDDTAKGITVLSMLGHPVNNSVQRMIEGFEQPTHFRTYPGERDPSFSANCNVLQALLHQPNPSYYAAQISKIVGFLSKWWWNADNGLGDKWNTSHLYSSLLLVESLVHLLFLVEQGGLKFHIDPKVPIVLFQACLRPLLDQESNGSWEQSVEKTAYATLLLAEARCVSFFDPIREWVETAIEKGVAFLSSTRTDSLTYLWSDKVSYTSLTLTETYVLAALKSARSPRDISVGSSLASIPADIAKRVKLFQKTPLLQWLPDAELQASMIEALLFQPLLGISVLEILPRDMVKGGTYPAIIPFTWTSCNNRARFHVSPSYLYEMMALSFYTYQVDEFMEAVVAPAFQGRIPELCQLIRTAVAQGTADVEGDNDILYTQENNHLPPSTDHEIFDLLRQFVKVIMGNPIIRAASPWDRDALQRETQGYLLAQSAQIEDSDQFKNQGTSASMGLSFYNWVHNVSSYHIACPFCFAYSNCLMGAALTTSTNRDCFSTGTEKYLAEDVCAHLGCMCRMYNDLGSWARDRDEGNLNSVHFAEFGSQDKDESAKKAEVFQLAQYERECWKQSFKQLEVAMREGKKPEEAMLGSRRARIVRYFCDVTDIYGQIYVLRDISSPIEAGMRVKN
ncbi:aphidicolan-16beta-ol synthase [Aspergillus sclerotioniger CBS 115572]|uniref:Aphidicolan-16beta-ol synthase n=1 Tax=Aspergillus sclerotioniger CBS 115572 TaxID=1450535 RepID=A0A317W2X6_9EURO|nr:aphidicolan-16beta-ol synthase [Aspergillus sclerotioniger CBS 115572]PWY80853.1 aphidicolan-16beta-ol synthase [Aspergillus sclerotioniger CBS 115572]